MDAISREQVDKLAEDISFVKKAIEKNSSILRQIDFRTSLRLVVLVTALATFFFCGVFHVLIRHFGAFSAIPTPTKAIAFCAIALVVAFIGIFKNTGVLKSARTFDPGISLRRLIREYYSFRLYHHFVPMGLVLAFACVYAVSIGESRFLVPILSIGVGLIYNSYDTLLNIDEFLWTSYWFIVTGFIVMVFNSISPLLSLSLTIGCGLLLLSVIWYLPTKKMRAEA
jgi:hypothetical protein